MKLNLRLHITDNNTLELLLMTCSHWISSDQNSGPFSNFTLFCTYTATNSYEVNKMVVQLSGRARLGSLTRHFSPGNNGMCELCDLELEDLHHFLLPKCPALLSRANILLAYMQEVLKQSEACLIIFGDILQQSRKDCRLWVQFVLDCSVIPQVVQVSQTDKAVLQLLFKVTRTWCYSLYRTRLKLLGRWCT